MHNTGNGIFKILSQSLGTGQAGPPRPQVVGLETFQPGKQAFPYLSILLVLYHNNCSWIPTLRTEVLFLQVSTDCQRPAQPCTNKAALQTQLGVARLCHSPKQHRPGQPGVHKDVKKKSSKLGTDLFKSNSRRLNTIYSGWLCREIPHCLKTQSKIQQQQISSITIKGT